MYVHLYISLFIYIYVGRYVYIYTHICSQHMCTYVSIPVYVRTDIDSDVDVDVFEHRYRFCGPAALLASDAVLSCALRQQPAVYPEVRTLRVQSTQILGMWSFYVRHRKYGFRVDTAYLGTWTLRVI